MKVPGYSDPWQDHYDHYLWELDAIQDMPEGCFPPGLQLEMINHRLAWLIAISSDE